MKMKSEYNVGLKENMKDLLNEARKRYDLRDVNDEILKKAIIESEGDIDKAINSLVKYL